MGGLELLTDVPTRWHSFVDMLSSIVRNWGAIKDTCRSLKLTCPVSDQDLARILLKTFVLNRGRDSATCAGLIEAAELLCTEGIDEFGILQQCGKRLLGQHVQNRFPPTIWLSPVL
ncbi:hypothetical protein Ciccas_009486 [Cichlidogyrus casuarinus]|uniref:Uncharacterized protein n=1 Tax=Cichlidogyrus casuarinus TaxID=1844966 RepID=A0ABD2PYC2_9PLAT